MKSFILFILTFTFVLGHSNQLTAQCTSVILSTQSQVNAFACNSINGSLIIEDDNDGIDNITSLNPIFVNGLQNGSISGDLIVRNCNELFNLLGLDGITSVGNRFEIANCPRLTSISEAIYPFVLTSVGEFLFIHGNSNLSDISALGSLTTLGQGISIQNQVPISNFSAFNQVTSCPAIELSTTNATQINGFDNLTTCGYLRINSNPILTSITGFSQLRSIQPAAGYNNYEISSNPNLSSITAYPNLTSVNNARIFSNPNLATCCFTLPFLASNPSPLDISNNANGCNSLAQIDSAPVLAACPADQTVNTDAGQCTATVAITSPAATFDFCGAANYTITQNNGDGSNQTGQAIGGQTFTYSLPSGKNTLSWNAEDESSRMASCVVTITVEDNEAPVMSNIPPNVTINCNDPFPSPPTPLVVDNCDGSPVLNALGSVSIGFCELGEDVEVQEYSFFATDASGNSTSRSWRVTRVSDFTFDLGAPVDICEGSNYMISPSVSGNNTYNWSTGASNQNISVTESGTYSLTITTENGCCYEDEIEVNFVSPPDATASDATLDCGASSTQLMGASTTAGAIYSWTGPGGFVSSLQNPTATNIGTYTLIVTSPEGCTATDLATVTGGTTLPDASASGGTIDCATTQIQLSASSITPGVTFRWAGPNSFSSTEQNPMVSTAGIYVLTVADPSGCEVTADAEVIDNTLIPVLDLVSDTVDCNITELVFSVAGIASWTGPNSFSSSEQSVTLSEPGMYSVTVTGANFCTNETTFEVVENFTAPDISAEGGIINCTSGQDTLKVISSVPGATYQWSGPNSFSTNIQNPIAVTTGTYTATVRSPNGCTSTQDVELVASLDAPSVTASGGTIDCIDTMIELVANSENSGLTYNWTGPEGFAGEGDTIMVSRPGSYTVVAINTDGCTGNATTQVIDDAAIPQVSIFADTINCLLGVSKFTTIVSQVVDSFSWSGPNDFISSEKEPEITVEGEYMLTVLADNGCSASTSAIVISDVASPTATATGGLLTCTQNTLSIEGTTTTEDAVFSWTGPDNFSSDQQNPLVSIPGTYFFAVTAANGCMGIDSATVLGDPDLPIIVATGGKIDCTNDEVTLMGSTQAEGASISWEGPNGFASSNANPVVDIPGTYKFTVVSAGSCVVFSEVEVNLDKRDPDLSLVAGRVNCLEGTRQLDLITNSGDALFSWIGPNEFTSDVQKPNFSDAGTYMVTITGLNGCVTSGSIEIETDVNFEANVVTSGNDATIEIIGGTGPFTTTIDDQIEGLVGTDLAEGDHFARIIDGLGCERVISFTIISTSVLDLEEQLKVKVYPNPAIEQIVIDWADSDILAEKLTIINSNGQVQEVLSVSGKQSFAHDIDDYAAGVYYIRIEGKDKLAFRKFLKI